MKNNNLASVTKSLFILVLIFIFSSCETTKLGYCICDCYNSSGVYIYRSVVRMAEDECNEKIQNNPDCDCFYDED